MKFNYDWITEQIDLLADSGSAIDREALQAFLIIERNSQETEIKSRLRVLIMHLLKWKYQPEKQTRSWKLTIREQRRQIQMIIDDSNNMKNKFMSLAHGIYRVALEDAADETELPLNSFPEDLEFSRKELLDVNFLP
jgi:hypothetical protein